MKSLIGMAALLLCSTAARAGAESQWTLGAGVGYASGEILGSVNGGAIGDYSGVTIPAAQAVTPVVSLERRIGTSDWLLLGLSGNITRQTMPLPATLSPYSLYNTSQTSGGAALALGVRHYFTEPGAPIGFSIHGALAVGIQQTSEDYTAVDENGVSTAGHGSATAWLVGGFAGIAVDKGLTDNLSLRLAVSLLSIQYDKTSVAPATDGGAQSAFGASLTFNPDLELRFAF